MLSRELAEPSLDESRPGVPVFEDSCPPKLRDCDSHGTTVGWIRLTDRETAFFQPIDEGSHAGLRQLFELSEFRYPQWAKRVEPTQRTQGAR
jgi:hypothetical protein